MPKRGGGKFSRKNQAARASASGSTNTTPHPQWQQHPYDQPHGYDQANHGYDYNQQHPYGQSNGWQAPQYAQGGYYADYPDYGAYTNPVAQVQPYAQGWGQPYAHDWHNHAHGRGASSDNWRDRSYQQAPQPYPQEYPPQHAWQHHAAYKADALGYYENGFGSNQRHFHSSSAAPGGPGGPARRHDRRSRSPSGAVESQVTGAPRGPAAMLLKSAIRAEPRTEYLDQAAAGSTLLSDEEAARRKLLVVLDLNGTLVFRAKGSNGRAMDSVRAIPRPYLLCFLQYCLGMSNEAPASDVASPASAASVEARKGPHGSHFWHDGHEPESHGNAHVVVWSSAQPANVDSMVRASFDAEVRASILRVWARDTLVPRRHFHHKAQSVKDLEIVWAELNASANGKPSPGRLLADARDQADQLLPDESSPAAPASNGAKSRAKVKQISAALEAAKQAEALGPWSAANTVLVDDSVAKARLQQHNHLLIPEFGKKDAQMMRAFIRQCLAAAKPHDAEEQGEDDVELEYDSDLSIANGSKDEKEKSEVEEEGKAKKKPVPESRLDDVLLQTIGVLDTLRHQSNVSAFIYAGGIKGYGEPKTAKNDQQRHELVQPGKTPEHWASVGRKACESMGIPVKAWTPSAAASATAALLC